MWYYRVFLQYLDIWLTLLILQMKTWGSREVQGLSAAWPELGSLPCPPCSPGGSSVLGQRPAAPFHTDALRDSGEGQWWEENQRLIQVLSFRLYIDVSPRSPLSKLFSPFHPWPGMYSLGCCRKPRLWHLRDQSRYLSCSSQQNSLKWLHSKLLLPQGFDNSPCQS